MGENTGSNIGREIINIQKIIVVFASNANFPTSRHITSVSKTPKIHNISVVFLRDFQSYASTQPESTVWWYIRSILDKTDRR